ELAAVCDGDDQLAAGGGGGDDVRFFARRVQEDDGGDPADERQQADEPENPDEVDAGPPTAWPAVQERAAEGGQRCQQRPGGPRAEKLEPGVLELPGGRDQPLAGDLEAHPQTGQLPQVVPDLQLDPVGQGRVVPLGPLVGDQAGPVGVPLGQPVEWAVDLD